MSPRRERPKPRPKPKPAAPSQAERKLAARSRPARASTGPAPRAGRRADGRASRPARAATTRASDLAPLTPLLEALGTMVAVVDRDGRIVQFNSACEAVSGYRFAELKGRHFEEVLLAPEERERVLAQFDEWKSGAGPFRTETHWVTRGGERRLISWLSLALCDRQGRPEQFLAAGLDVTRHRQVEEELRRSEANWRALIEHASDGICLSDMDSLRFLEVNPGYCELVGYTREELLGMSLPDVLEASDLAHRPLDIARLKGGKPVHVLRSMRRKDGTILIAEVGARQLPDGRLLGIVRDTAERERAETARRESEAKYRRLHETLMDAFVVVGMDGRILEFNELYRAMLGYEREELLALTYLDLTPEPWHAFEAAIVAEQVLPRGHSEVYEKEYRRKDGTVFPVELRTVLLRDDSGEPAAMWATVRDVSGRRRAEEALRESEERFKSLFENSLLGLYRTTPGGDILMANPALCRMLGFATYEELERRNLEREGFEPEYPREEFKRRMAEEGRVVGLESHWTTHDGRTLYVRESARVVRGADGEIRFFEGTVEDITERRRAEEALRENEARYRAVVDQGSDGITITDRAWRFLDVNPRACELFGRSRGELLEMSVREIGVPEDLSAHPLHDAELERGRTILTTRALRRADGSVFTAEISARGLPDGRVVSIVRDVTERARMEHALRESETRYRGLVEQASDGIWIMSMDTVLLEVNSRLCELVGWRRDELVGRKAAEFLVPDELGRNPLRVEAVSRGETVLNERTIRRRDGTTFPAETSTRALPDGRVIGIVRDITERMETERSLRESEERLRRVVESDMIGILFGLHGGKVVDANDYFLRLLGMNRNDLLAGRLRWNAITPPEHGDRMAEAIRQAYATGVSLPFETEFIRQDGSRVPVLAGAAFIGREQRFGVAFAIDLTERKRVEQRLAESERYLVRAQELAQFGTWEVDLATRTGRWSTGAARIFGMPDGPRMVDYAQYTERLHPEDRAAIERRMWDAIEGRPIEREIEHRIVRPDGSIRVVRATVDPQRDASGAVVRLIGSLQDVTERRFLEQQLREAQKLEAIGRLAGGVAHDFNNLLTVILGYAETLLAGLGDEDPRRTSVGQVRTAARRAAALTQQLLAFGRRQMFQLRVFDLNEVVLEMQEILQRLIGPPVGIQTRPEATCARIRADRGQIEQVILNLALNARDAMPGGGILTIATRDVERMPGEPGGPGTSQPCVMLVVSDTGMGMTPEVQAHIFEPFYTTKEVGQGTGLGLATVYGIVTQTGGTIEVASAPGEGTTLRVLLPCAAGEAEREEGTAAEPAPGGRETVLVVEDEAAVRSLMVDVLRRRGYRVLEAAEGTEALRLAAEHDGALDILVTDVVMPGMSGNDLARRLEAERPGLRVLYVSGYSDEDVGPRVAGGPPQGFLQKPFTPEILARRIREVLGQPGFPAAGY